MTRVTQARFRIDNWAIARSVYRFAGVLMLMLVCACGLQAQATLTVAAAADLQPALREIAAEFRQRTGIRISPVFGSSGSLTTQIEHGAPYDVFMSADLDYPHQLESRGLSVLGSLTTYAVGKLVLWTPKTSGLDVRKLGLAALTAPEVRAIAIANPQHAPYGKAAVAALRRSKLYDGLNSKLVFGENVAQAAQFVVSGNAQIGIIPLSLALAPEMARTGQWWSLPAESYPPIQQAAVVLRKSKNQNAAQEFVDFLKTAGAAAVLTRYGFGAPEARP